MSKEEQATYTFAELNVELRDLKANHQTLIKDQMNIYESMAKENALNALLYSGEKSDKYKVKAMQYHNTYSGLKMAYDAISHTW